MEQTPEKKKKKNMKKNEDFLFEHLFGDMPNYTHYTLALAKRFAKRKSGNGMHFDVGTRK